MDVVVQLGHDVAVVYFDLLDGLVLFNQLGGQVLLFEHADQHPRSHAGPADGLLERAVEQ